MKENVRLFGNISNKQKKYSITSMVLIATLALVIAPVSLVPSAEAFPHAGIVINPNPSDPNQQNANPISLFLGHTNEPTFGVREGVHDGKHGVEVFLSDAATELPISGAQLTVDKYYFEDFDSFNAASSPNDADDIQTGVPLPEAFGDKGHYLTRQIQQPGIYGYKLSGTINYYGVAQVPVSTTVFCSLAGHDTTKFNSPGWFGGFGCTENIEDIYFPSTTTFSQQSSPFDASPSTIIITNDFEN
jgi:hypothetical protein